MSESWPFAVAVALALASGGCSEGLDDSGHRVSLGAARAPILDGDIAASGPSLFPAVVGLYTYQSGVPAICTGTLLLPNLVLTAHHCVADVLSLEAGSPPGSGALGQAGSPQGIGGVSGQTESAQHVGGVGGQTVSSPTLSACDRIVFEPPMPPELLRITRATEMYPELLAQPETALEIWVPEAPVACGSDLALVLLATPSKAEGAPDGVVASGGSASLLVGAGSGGAGELAAAIVPSFAAASVGMRYTAVGYGSDGELFGVRRWRAGIVAECLAEGCADQAVAGEFAGEAVSLAGDSGGPALSEQGELLGVLSRHISDDARAVYVELGPWQSWIVENVREAATRGQLPLPRWAASIAGAGGAAGAEGERGEDAGQWGVSDSQPIWRAVSSCTVTMAPGASRSRESRPAGCSGSSHIGEGAWLLLILLLVLRRMRISWLPKASRLGLACPQPSPIPTRWFAAKQTLRTCLRAPWRQHCASMSQGAMGRGTTTSNGRQRNGLGVGLVARAGLMGVGFVGILLLGLGGACGSERRSSGADDLSCQSGATRDCLCDADHSGTQRCRSDGGGYSACDCTVDGVAGASGTAGATGAELCIAEGVRCERSGDCCSFPDGACIWLDGEAACAPGCDTNGQCDTGCCALLDDYSGACALESACGETGCRLDGSSCDSVGDCCGFDTETPTSYCVDLGRGGPGVCSGRCDDADDCESGCCLELGNGDSACFPSEDC